jgi:hypothetical protein
LARGALPGIGILRKPVSAAAILFAAFAFTASAAAAKNVPLPRPSPHKVGTPQLGDAPTALAPGDATDPGAGGDDAGIPADAAAPADANAPADATAPAGDGDPAFDEPDVPVGTPTTTTETIGEPEPLVDEPLDLSGATDVRPPGNANYKMEAKLAEGGAPLSEGVTWRVFANKPGADGTLPEVTELTGGSVAVKLDPGTYLVHAAFGRAGTTKRITVTPDRSGGVFVLNAGGMRLSALVGKDQPLPPGEVSFDIYAPDEGGAEERALLMPNAPAGTIIGLNAGTYHVISRYGDSNAVVRADIRVEAGKLTEATVYQKAARMTLKLVAEHGGEALADTAWSVVTPAGESVAENVGAFPSVVLAAGDYTAIAKHDGKIFERNFTVEAGLNRDVEVIAK